MRKLFVPLFTLITVPYILLALLIAAGGTYVVTRLIFDSLEERFINQLVETAILSEQSLARSQEDMLAALRLASRTQGVANAVQAGDAQGLVNLVLPSAFNSKVQAVAVLDASGQPLLSVFLDADQDYKVLEPARNYQTADFVQTVLNGDVDATGDKFAGYFPTAQGEIFFVSGPIYNDQDALVGVALVGSPAATLVEQIRTETLAQISLYSDDGQLVASTLDDPQPVPVDQAEELAEQHGESSLTRHMDNAGLNYNEVISPWEIRGEQTLGFVGVALPPQFLVQASQFTRENTLLLMVGTLSLVVLLGVLLARQISGPIIELKDAAQAVTDGNLQVRVPPEGNNEVGMLTRSFNRMVSSLYTSQKNLIRAYNQTIEGWAKATDMRDHETEGHSRRVADLSVALAKSMGMSEPELVDIYRGALLHDIGKMAIPDQILLKRGKLTPAERKQMEAHPDMARRFISQIEFLRAAGDIPYCHHERWDGSGYPRGLKGEEIPLSARVFAVVDVWDAMTSDRPYRKAQSFKKTLAQIESEAGHHFDPRVVEAFKKLLGR